MLRCHGPQADAECGVSAAFRSERVGYQDFLKFLLPEAASSSSFQA